eukprot:2394221-Prymnesium_polylepis.1
MEPEAMDGVSHTQAEGMEGLRILNEVPTRTTSSEQQLPTSASPLRTGMDLPGDNQTRSRGRRGGSSRPSKQRWPQGHDTVLKDACRTMPNANEQDSHRYRIPQRPAVQEVATHEVPVSPPRRSHRHTPDLAHKLSAMLLCRLTSAVNRTRVHSLVSYCRPRPRPNTTFSHRRLSKRCRRSPAQASPCPRLRPPMGCACFASAALQGLSRTQAT